MPPYLEPVCLYPRETWWNRADQRMSFAPASVYAFDGGHSHIERRHVRSPKHQCTAGKHRANAQQQRRSFTRASVVHKRFCEGHRTIASMDHHQLRQGRTCHDVSLTCRNVSVSGCAMQSELHTLAGQGRVAPGVVITTQASPQRRVLQT